MFSYWQHNKNVILAAVALFMVSLTGLLFFLSGDTGGHGLQAGHGDLKANVVDAGSGHGENADEKIYREALGEALKETASFTVVKPDGHVEFLNADYEKMTGYHLKDIKDQLFFSFIHPEDLPKIMSAFGKVIAEDKPVLIVGPYRMRNANGEYHFHIASLYPMKSTAIGFVVRDITSEVTPQTQETQDPSQAHDNTDKIGEEPQEAEGPKEEDNKLVVEKLAQLIRDF